MPQKYQLTKTLAVALVINNCAPNNKADTTARGSIDKYLYTCTLIKNVKLNNNGSDFTLTVQQAQGISFESKEMPSVIDASCQVDGLKIIQDDLLGTRKTLNNINFRNDERIVASAGSSCSENFSTFFKCSAKKGSAKSGESKDGSKNFHCTTHVGFFGSVLLMNTATGNKYYLNSNNTVQAKAENIENLNNASSVENIIDIGLLSGASDALTYLASNNDGKAFGKVFKCEEAPEYQGYFSKKDNGSNTQTVTITPQKTSGTSGSNNNDEPWGSGFNSK